MLAALDGISVLPWPLSLAHDDATPQQAEALRAELGGAIVELELAWNLGLKRIELESDSLILVNGIKGG